MNRNQLLSFFKGMACMCVVFMHIEFPGVTGVAVQAVSRWAVPLFFMISGYFCVYDKSEIHKKLSGKINHIAIIVLESIIIYLVYECTKYIFGFGTSTLTHVSVTKILYLILFNEPFVISGHLWFLFALLYTYAFLWIMCKLNIIDKARKIVPYLLIVVFIGGQVLYSVGINIPNYFYRNFLFEGIPFFILGYNIRINREKLATVFSNKSLVIILIISTFLCIPERYLEQREFGLMICSLFQVVSIFLLSIKNPDVCICRAISKLGDKYSLCVYLYHIVIGEIVIYVLSLLNIVNQVTYLIPIITVSLTILVAFIREFVIRCFKNLRAHN